MKVFSGGKGFGITSDVDAGCAGVIYLDASAFPLSVFEHDHNCIHDLRDLQWWSPKITLSWLDIQHRHSSPPKQMGIPIEHGGMAHREK